MNIEQVWASIQKDPDTGCWIWTRCTTTSGYGEVVFEGKKHMAHRLIYTLVKGAIPPGMYACHICDVTQCCNPDHLFLGTQADNMRDCREKGRTGKRPRGMESPASRLTEADALRIRALRGVVPQRRLAAEYRVAKGTVQAIHEGRTWTHLFGTDEPKTAA